ncbi:MAG: hypothetical protein OYH77_02450 [Pseudomonadota bacterium]|nr:hypothetical protein [Pseudomonadota bacterium]
MVCIRLVWLFLLLTAAASQTERLEMVVGESRIMPLFSEQEVLVSKKGVVRVEHLRGEMFELIALKAGVVLIQTRAQGNKKYLLRVRKVRSSFGSACEQAGVICSDNAIAGSTDDVRVYLQARAKCQRRCSFTLRLSDDAMHAWLQQTRALLGERFSVSAHGNARLLALAHCNKQSREELRKLADSLTGGYVAQGLLYVGCLQQHDISMYRLSAKVLLVNQAKARELGVREFQKLLAYDVSSLSWMQLRRISDVIGQPRFSLINGAEAVFETGGELQYVSSDKDGQHTNWKFYGLALRVRVDKINALQAKVLLDFTLKSPTANSRSTFNSSRFTSTLALQIARSKAVSVIGYRSDSKGREFLPLINKIPIIGILFNRLQSESALNKIIIWMQLDYDDGKNESMQELFDKF